MKLKAEQDQTKLNIQVLSSTLDACLMRTQCELDLCSISHSRISISRGTQDDATWWARVSVQRNFITFCG
jgi:hypothetical protein